MFEFKDINNKKILVSDYIDKSKAFHCFTTRESVTTARDLLELEYKALSNLEEIAKHLDIGISNIISPEQIHSDIVKVTDIKEQKTIADALIVDNSNIAILLNFADCTPIILYDTKNNIGAIVHAGWKGTAKSITAKTVLKMNELYNSQTKNIIAIIGPSISLKNYEVGYDVYRELRHTLNTDYTDWYIFNQKENKYKVDLKEVNKHQLEELGVSRIDKCQYCTYDSIDVFFSYRRENGITARHSAIFKLVK
jgi:YfiH family protein